MLDCTQRHSHHAHHIYLRNHVTGLGAGQGPATRAGEPAVQVGCGAHHATLAVFGKMRSSQLYCALLSSSQILWHTGAGLGGNGGDLGGTRGRGNVADRTRRSDSNSPHPQLAPSATLRLDSQQPENPTPCPSCTCMSEICRSLGAQATLRLRCTISGNKHDGK
eukprot:1180734-Prorocentrum_minimum.AAC.6